MSDHENSRSDASAEPDQPTRPVHEQLPLLGSDAWAPRAAPAPEPAREDIPVWLRPTQDVPLPAAPTPDEPNLLAPAEGVRAQSAAPEHLESDDAPEPRTCVEEAAPDQVFEPAAADGRVESETEGDAEADMEPVPAVAVDDPVESDEPHADESGETSEEPAVMWPQDDPDFRPFADLTPKRPDDEQNGTGEDGDEADTEAVASATIGAASGTTPLVDRVRPPREPYVSRKAILFGLLGVLVVALIAGGIVWYAIASRIEVPNVVGSMVGIAQVDATRQGLEVVVGQNRFSSYPKGQVLEQSPPAGTMVRRGAQLELVVSAGTELFSLPDVTGMSIAVAKGQLQERGLNVEPFTQPSQEPSGTVVSMLPGPNTPVRTGDVVRLAVSSQTSEGSLKSYQLAGRVFVLDPAPAVSGTNDITLEITRRLQALLEASDAKVVSARTAADSSSSEASRAKRAKSVAANALIGFSVASSGAGGMQVRRAETTNIAQAAESQQLEADVVKALTAAGYDAKSGALTKDAVLAASSGASVRVVLGSASSKKDKGAFRDPKWADGVAQAIYQALGQRYGSK